MKLFWLDLETTSLDPATGAILELAVAEADLRTPFDHGPIRSRVFGWDEREHRLSELVRDMHTNSGLFDECATSAWSVRDVEDDLLTFVPEVADKDDRPTLAGRGVHFDLGFLRKHMPRLAARLSYRVYDVSAVGLFCESLGMPRLKKREAHRASADVLESIEHAKRCAEWLTGGA